MNEVSAKIFEEFVEVMRDVVAEELGEEYQVEVMTTMKQGDNRLKGLQCRRHGISIAPVIYLEGYYKEYRRGMPLQEIAGMFIEDMVKESQQVTREFTLPEFTRDWVYENVRCRLINFQNNEGYLSDKPYVKFLDLVAMFVVDVCLGDGKVGSIIINNRILEQLNMTTPDLYLHAKENFQHNPDVVMAPLEKVLEVVARGGVLGKELTDIEESPVTEPSMYIVTCKSQQYGASVLLYEEELQRIADKLGKNLIVLPSSVHEVIVVGEDSSMSPEYLKNMVQEVNDTEVQKEDRLSYNIYRFDKTEGRLYIM